MANLKEIRTRLSSIKSTRQITSAMKMVSAAKLRKAQDAIIQMRPYANKLHEILENLTATLESEKENIYGSVREIKKILLIVITSNKGLCGAFNSNVIKHVIGKLNADYKKYAEKHNLDILAIGKKGADYFRSHKYKVTDIQNDLIDTPDFSSTVPIISKVMEDFVNKKYDKVEIIYNQFKNAANQILVQEQFLPIVKEEKFEDRFETQVDYILEPSREEIIHDLIPKSLKIQFFKAILDSVASEHGARMTAMHKATDNSTELIRELQLNYNKARQSVITNEILEIVAGAEALKG